jgi:hypothetical protein
MNRAQTLGNIFSLPQATNPQFGGTQVGGGGRTPAAPVMDDKYFGIPDAPEGLDYTGEIDGRSRDVMKRWSDLRNFANSMRSMYQIDVTRPDPARPESIAANQAFHQELANIQYDIDSLKTSREDYKRRATLAEQNQYSFNDTVGRQLQGNLTPNQAGQTQMVNPTVEFAAGQLGDAYRLPGDVAAAQGQVDQLTGGFAQAGDNMSALQSSLINPRLDPFAPRDDSKGDSSQSSVFEYLKRLSAVAKGAVDFKISDAYNDPTTGTPLSSTKEFNDAFEGIDRKSGRQATGLIEEILRNPQTGAMYLKLSTQDDLIPVSGSELMYGISKANPKYPTVDKLTTFLGKFGGTDNVGELQPDMFLDKSAISKADANTQRLGSEAAQISAAEQELKGIVGDSYQGSGWTRPFVSDSSTPPLGKLGGISIEFQRDNDGNVVINNRSDVVKKLKALGLDPTSTLENAKSTEGFVKFLKKFGATPATSPTTPTPVVNQGGKKIW